MHPSPVGEHHQGGKPNQGQSGGDPTAVDVPVLKVPLNGAGAVASRPRSRCGPPSGVTDPTDRDPARRRVAHYGLVTHMNRLRDAKQ